MIEILVVIAILIVIAGLLMPATMKALKRAKSWIWGTYYFHENQLNAFIEDKPNDTLMFWTTNKPGPWVWVRINSNGTYTIVR